MSVKKYVFLHFFTLKSVSNHVFLNDELMKSARIHTFSSKIVCLFTLFDGAAGDGNRKRTAYYCLKSHFRVFVKTRNSFLACFRNRSGDGYRRWTAYSLPKLHFQRFRGESRMWCNAREDSPAREDFPAREDSPAREDPQEREGRTSLRRAAHPGCTLMLSLGTSATPQPTRVFARSPKKFFR